MNKNFLLFTLILIASCFGILGVAEKGNADVPTVCYWISFDDQGQKCTDTERAEICGPSGCTGTCDDNGTLRPRGEIRCFQLSQFPQLPTTPTTPANSITVSEPASTSSGSTVNLSNKPLSEILEDLIKWLLKIVILIAILMIIVSGVLYMISAGDQTKTDTAKKALTYAILGLLVVALAYAIVNTLVDILAG